MILAGLGIYAGVGAENKFQNLQQQETLRQSNAVFNPSSLQRIREANEYVKNLLNIPDIIERDNAYVKSYDEVFKNVGQNTYNTQSNAEEVFKRGMFYLLKSDVKNQVAQILNYDSNRISGSKQLIGLMANCNMVLKKYNKDTNNVTKRVFEESLDNTVNALYEDKYQFYVNMLKANNKKSFIIAPITSSTHLFSVVLYKRQENHEIYYEMIIVNKGGRTEKLQFEDKMHSMYESYKIPKENIPEITSMLGYIKVINDYNFKELTTGEIYERLRKYTINNTYQELGYRARGQVIGNCYYKELEAGFKFAYSNAYNAFEIKKIQGIEYQTPKWPIDTMKFQQQLIFNINNVIQEFPHLSVGDKTQLREETNKMLSAYTKNKNFRKTLEQKQINGRNTLEVFVDVFGNGGINDLEKIKDKEILKELLQDVDYITFNRYKRFFMSILRKSGISIPDVLEKAVKVKDVTKYISDYMVKNKQNKSEFLKEYLPLVYDVTLVRYNKLIQQSRSKAIVKENNIASKLDMSQSEIYPHF